MTRAQLLAAIDAAVQGRVGFLITQFHDQIIQHNGKADDEVKAEFKRAIQTLLITYTNARTIAESLV